MIVRGADRVCILGISGWFWRRIPLIDQVDQRVHSLYLKEKMQAKRCQNMGGMHECSQAS